MVDLARIIVDGVSNIDVTERQSRPAHQGGEFQLENSSRVVLASCSTTGGTPIRNAG